MRVAGVVPSPDLLDVTPNLTGHGGALRTKSNVNKPFNALISSSRPILKRSMPNVMGTRHRVKRLLLPFMACAGTQKVHYNQVGTELQILASRIQLTFSADHAYHVSLKISRVPSGRSLPCFSSGILPHLLQPTATCSHNPHMPVSVFMPA